MTYEEISELWLADCEINAMDLTREVNKTARLLDKYYRIYMVEGMRLKKLKAKFNDLRKAKTAWYSGQMDEIDMKALGWKPFKTRLINTQVASYVDADKDIVEMTLAIGAQEFVVKYAENLVQRINSRGFDIKAIQEFEKFRSGG